MSVILGLDAAWTENRASGIAVLAGSEGNWRCAGAASSYAEFFARAGTPGLLQAAEALAGGSVDIAAVDMPLARVPILARRACDNAISRAFGAAGCGVHSATPERPGRVSANLMAMLDAAGYELAVAGTRPRPRQVIEVYPHVAVMRLLGERYRVPYKVGRMRQYWPEDSSEMRRSKLRANLGRILEALRARIAGIPLELPDAGARPSEIKRFEDALDAVVCAWIGAEYLAGRCAGYGDESAAIWCPGPSDVRSAAAG